MAASKGSMRAVLTVASMVGSMAVAKVETMDVLTDEMMVAVMVDL